MMVSSELDEEGLKKEERERGKANLALDVLLVDQLSHHLAKEQLGVAIAVDRARVHHVATQSNGLLPALHIHTDDSGQTTIAAACHKKEEGKKVKAKDSDNASEIERAKRAASQYRALRCDEVRADTR